MAGVKSEYIVLGSKIETGRPGEADICTRIDGMDISNEELLEIKEVQKRAVGEMENILNKKNQHPETTGAGMKRRATAGGKNLKRFLYNNFLRYILAVIPRLQYSEYGTPKTGEKWVAIWFSWFGHMFWQKHYLLDHKDRNF